MLDEIKGAFGKLRETAKFQEYVQAKKSKGMFQEYVQAKKSKCMFQQYVQAKKSKGMFQEQWYSSSYPTILCKKIPVCLSKNWEVKVNLFWTVLRCGESCWQLKNSHGCPTRRNLYWPAMHLQDLKPQIVRPRLLGRARALHRRSRISTSWYNEWATLSVTQHLSVSFYHSHCLDEHSDLFQLRLVILLTQGLCSRDLILVLFSGSKVKY